MALGRRNNRSYGVPVRPVAVERSVPAMAAGTPTATTPSGMPAADFFAPAPVPQAYPAPSGPPAPQAGYRPWSPHQSSLPPLPPARAGRSRLLSRGAIGLLVMIALGGWRGYRALSHSAGITVPTTLSGQQQVHHAATDAVLADMRSAMQDQNPGTGVAVAAYGADGTPSVVLGVMRGRIDIEQELKDMKATTRKSYGPVTCAKTDLATQVVCLWSGSVSGLLLAGDRTMADVAQITQEARAATK